MKCCLVAALCLLPPVAAAGCGPAGRQATPQPARAAAASLPLEQDAAGCFVARFKVMGTAALVKVAAADASAAGALLARTEGALRAVEERMSTYRPESDISRLNRLGAGQAVELSAGTLEVLRRSLGFSRLSGGAFDVTYAPLRTLWRGAAAEGAPPGDAEVAAALAKVGHDKLVLDGTSARFAVPGMEVDLGGIAKGYGIDAAVAVLREEGGAAGLVDVGGDLRVMGRRPDGSAWRIEVADPRPGRHEPIVLRVADCAVATSGHSARNFTVGGRSFSHIIDPRTGRPAAAAASVTVIAPDALTADALATAISVLGPAAGLALVESVDGVEALIMAPRPGQEAEPVASSGFYARAGGAGP